MKEKQTCFASKIRRKIFISKMCRIFLDINLMIEKITNYMKANEFTDKLHFLFIKTVNKHYYK